jgi:PAS domain S-box-containing protein
MKDFDDIVLNKNDIENVRELKNRINELENKIKEIENKSKDLEIKVKDYEIKFQEVQQWNKALFENSPDMIIIHDLNGNILDINEITYRNLGFESKEDFFNNVKNVLDVIVAEEREKAIKNMTETALKGFIKRNEYTVLNKNGEKLFIEASTNLLYDFEGKPKAFLSLIRDITEKKISEKFLIESETRYRILFESANDGIVILDKDNFIDCNNKALEIFGCTKKQFVGKSPYEFSPEYQPDGKSSYDKALEKINNAIEGKPQFFEWLHCKYDKTPIYTEVSLNSFTLNGKLYLLTIIRDITEKKRFEQKIIEQQKQLFDIISYLPDPTLVIDSNGIVIAFNKAMEELTGIKANDIIGKGNYEYAIPFYGERRPILVNLALNYDENIAKKYNYIKKEEDILIVEIPIDNFKGKKVFLWKKASPLYDINGNIIGAIETIRDITEQKLNELALQESERKFREIFNSVNEAIFIDDANTGKIIDVNDTMLKIYGYNTKEEVISGNIGDLSANILPYTEEEAQKRIKKAIEEGPQTFEWLAKKKNGEQFWVEVSLKRAEIVGEDRLIAVVRDISERKKTEELIKKYTKKLDAIIDAVNIGTWEWNLLTDEIIYNEKWANLLGYTLDELKPITSKTWKELTHPDDRKKAYLAFEEHFSGKSSQYECEFRMMHKNGTWVWILDKGKVVEWIDDGTPLLMYGIHIDITKLKETEIALKESKKFLDIVLNTIPARLFWKDKNLKYLGCNKSFAMDAGFDNPDELIGKDDYEMPWKEQADLYSSDDKIVVEKDTPKIGYEEIQTTKEGRTKWLRTSKVPLKDNEGNIIGVLGTYEDITEKKLVEEKLKESEEKFRILANMSPTSILLYQDDKWIYANPAALKLSEYDENELLNMNFWDYVHPLDREIVIERGKRRQREEKVPDDYEFRIISKSGKVKWVHLYGSSIIYNGKPAAIISVLDITERKLAEEALAEEKEKLQITLQSIGDGVIATDKDGKVILINKAAQNLTGFEEFETVGKNISEIFNIYNEKGEKVSIDPIETVLKTGNAFELPDHSILISKDGSRRFINDSAAPIKDLSGKIVGVVLVFRDITEKLKLLEQVQNAQKLESIGLLAAGIAHDFNNILVGIYSNIELASHYTNDERTIELIKNAIESIERAKALTNQLLTFSKGGEPIKKLQSIVPLLKSVTQFVLSGSKVKAEFDIEEKIYNAEFDYNQISQVIENIVINAVQAMPGGGVVKISAKNILLDNEVFNKDKLSNRKLVNYEKYENMDNNFTDRENLSYFIKISIADNGIGIPKEILPKIFDPFFTTKEKGNGLGLSICHSIITKHKGFIEVESEEGKGTTFHVYLPAKKENVIEISKRENGKILRTGKVLILDDEEVIQKVLCKILSHIGFKCLIAKDGEEAIEIFNRERDRGENFDLLIFDMTIKGGMGGDKAIEEIRKIDSNVIAFVMSGYTEGPIFSEPQKFGFNEIIQKPFTIDDIKKLLSKYF